MLIDWFTVIAQIINFLILIWFLKRYLYLPILRAIDEREKKIAEELASASEEKENSIKTRKELELKNKEFDVKRNALLEEATSKAAKEKLRLMENARTESEAMKAKLFEAGMNEYDNIKKDIYSKTQKEVFSIVRKTLSELADSQLEESVIRRFLKKISSFSEAEKDTLISAITASDNNITVAATFSMSSELQRSVTTSLARLTASEPLIVFQKSESPVYGIELICRDYKLEWNIADYIDSMEKSLPEKLDEKFKVKTEQGAANDASR